MTDTLDTLDTFIKNNISTINKNHNIYIDFGQIISEHIFENKHTYALINRFISSLKKMHNVTMDKPQIIKSYFTNNTVLDIYHNKIINYSYTSDKTIQYKYNNIHCKIIYITINNRPNLNSYYNYILIEDKEEMIFHYKNMFDIIINKFSNKTYSIKIKIQKPIEDSILLENINYIIDLF